jgi:hypothetical protein
MICISEQFTWPQVLVIFCAIRFAQKIDQKIVPSEGSYSFVPPTFVQGVNAPTAWTLSLRFQILVPQKA